MRKAIMAAIMAAVTITSTAPAFADPHHRGGRHGYDKRYYYSDGRYRQPRRITRNDHVWRENGRYYCRRDNGTTGLIIGAGVGALLGNAVDGGRNRTLGTVLGAVGGGLAGREIDRGGLKCR